MSFASDIAESVTGGLATDFTKWVASKTRNTRFVRELGKYFNPEQLHPATRALLEEAMAEVLDDVEPAERREWKKLFKRPKNRVQLIGWVFEWHGEARPSFEHWSLENGLDELVVRAVLGRLFEVIQQKKPKHFPGYFFNLLGNQITMLDFIESVSKEVIDLKTLITRQAQAFAELLKLPESAHQLPIASIIALPPLPYFAPSYALQENFTGRVDERGALTAWFAQGIQPVFAYIAIGGMGKSALTWLWVQRDVLGQALPGQRDDPPEVLRRCRVAEAARPEGVMWWSFYERESAFATFLDRALIYTSDASLDPASIPSMHDKVHALVSLLERRPILLILDGLERELRAYASLNAAYQGDAVVEDPGGDYRSCIDPNAGDFLRECVSRPLKGRVLITSRLFPKELEGVGEIPYPACCREELTELDLDVAVDFFQAQAIRGTRAEIEEHCAPYGYHPLALRLIAGVAVKSKRRRRDIRAIGKKRLLPKLEGKWRHHVLKVAYDAMPKDRRTLLSRIAAFRGPVAWQAMAMFNDYGSEEAFDEALDELLDRGLLVFDEKPKQYDLHPIVRQYAYDRLRDKEGTHTRLRDYFDAVPKPEKVERIEDLNPVIELYHHTVHAGRYDDAFRLFRDRLHEPLYYRFGAYQRCIKLIPALFPEGEPFDAAGEAVLPRLMSKDDQGWTLAALGNAYSLSGQSQAAATLFSLGKKLDEEKGDKKNLAIASDLGNLAEHQGKLGELAAAEDNLRRAIDLAREVDDAFEEASHRQELGLVLIYRGGFDEAARELEAAGAIWRDQHDVQGECLVALYRAQRALFMGHADKALEAAREARRFCKQDAEEDYPVERDFVEAEWLLGWSLVALAEEDEAKRAERLQEAEGHLDEALRRCRRINLIEFEPDILLACAGWRRAMGHTADAKQRADEALKIADRCEFRFVQADCHNFLARLALDAGDRAAARREAEIAKERAWCDGPPHCYKPALDEAERLLSAECGMRSAE